MAAAPTLRQPPGRPTTVQPAPATRSQILPIAPRAARVHLAAAVAQGQHGTANASSAPWVRLRMAGRARFATKHAHCVLGRTPAAASCAPTTTISIPVGTVATRVMTPAKAVPEAHPQTASRVPSTTTWRNQPARARRATKHAMGAPDQLLPTASPALQVPRGMTRNNSVCSCAIQRAAHAQVPVRMSALRAQAERSTTAAHVNCATLAAHLASAPGKTTVWLASRS